MATIGIVIKPEIDAAIPLAESIYRWSKSQGHQVIFDSISAKIMEPTINEGKLSSVINTKLAQVADPIVTLGGDGTLIGIARYVDQNSTTLIGVNFGNLGFLTEILPVEALDTLKNVLSGNCAFAERNILLSEVYRDDKLVFSSQAVNDAVVQKGARDRLLDLDLAVNGEAVMRLRADGIIVSSPTGSTAYSLSAGGSIVHPSLGVALITPICPHSLTNRSLILDMDSTIQIRIPHYEGNVYLTIDGQKSTSLVSGDELRITRAQNKVRFVRSPRKSYYEILRTKLNWGIANKFE